nr:methyl-accepting chemotaxis protein [uncultured Desulfobacter sp.]
MILIEKAELIEGAASVRKIILGITVLILAVIGGLSFFISGKVVKPINQMVDGLKDIAQGEGDLTMRPAAKSSDEIGEMARWFNLFVEKLPGIIAGIAEDSDEIEASSSALPAIAGELSKGTDTMEEKSNSVAAATEEMSTNMLPAAVEEQSVTTREIATNVGQAALGIQEITENLPQTSGVANDSEKDIGEVNQDLGLISQNSTQIDTSAGGLSNLSSKLKHTMNQFKV